MSGKEIPYTRCSDSLLESPRKYDAEFCRVRESIAEKDGQTIYFGNHEGLDLASVRNVRPDTEVDHGTTAIDCGGRAIWDFALD